VLAGFFESCELHWATKVPGRSHFAFLRFNAILYADLFEIEISQIHVSVGQYVHGENIVPFSQTDFEKLWRQIPMVPPGARQAGLEDHGL
jgi:hypothetical protein